MRILFFFPREKAYNSDTVRNSPCGGTEKAVIFLGEALRALGREVRWVTTLGEGIDTAWPQVVITQEAEILERFPDAQKVWWSHHFADQPITRRSAPFARCFADKVVTLSLSHQADILTELKIPSVVTGHGLWHAELADGEKEPFRLIYASTPFRGLDRLPDLFKSIKSAEPRATLSVCSGMGTYGTPEKDAEYALHFKRLSEIEGVTVFGPLNQSELYREYARAAVLLYPCTWRETYCLALDEAIAHGCATVTTGLAALGERSEPFETDEDLVDGVLAAFAGGRCYNPPVSDWSLIAERWAQEVLM